MEMWELIDVFEAFKDVPLYHILIELLLLVCVIWLIFSKNQDPTPQLSPQEISQILEEYEPYPLVPEVDSIQRVLQQYTVHSKAQKYIQVNKFKCLNLATHNYLGFVGNEEIEEHAINTIKKYGVGSCGPRGFYGTVDVHLELEDRLAGFMQSEDACVYSYGFSTVASAIPAYSKRGDIIFVDENVNFSIQKGLDASRSKIKYFKHNDCDDLERLLSEQNALDVKNTRRASVTRRFIIVEGVYMNSGDICPLKELIALSKKYKTRLFLDESISFGSLGKYGRGVTEYFGVNRDDVDLIMCSMEWSMASIGGFCVGSSFVVEHQRLSGLGYCFSASLPPLLTTAAIKALELMERDHTQFSTLQKCCNLMHDNLSKLDGLVCLGHRDSPVKHLMKSDGVKYTLPDELLLNRIMEYCLEHGVAICVPAYLRDVEKFPQVRTLRVTVNNKLTEDEIDNAVMVIQQAIHTVKVPDYLI